MKNYQASLAGIAFLGFTLLIVTGCRNQPATTNAPAVQTMPKSAGNSSPATITIAADEASCPVLGTVMKKSEMIPLQHKGVTYYMCCQGCVPQFKANPEKYIAHPATPKHGM